MSDLRKAAEMALWALRYINQYSLAPHNISLPGEIDTAVDALRAALAQPDTEMQTYKDALTWISSVNAMDYEYQRKAKNALKAHGIGGEHE